MAIDTDQVRRLDDIRLDSNRGCDEVPCGILNSGATSTAQRDDREGRYYGDRPSTVS